MRLMYEKKVERFHYNSDKRILTICYRNGICRSYSDVPQKTYEDLIKTNDQNAYIKNYIDGRFALDS